MLTARGIEGDDTRSPAATLRGSWWQVNATW